MKRALGFGSAAMAISWSGAAVAQSAPLEIETSAEAVTVATLTGDTEQGTDNERILYEFSLDARAEKVLENGLQIGGRLTVRAQRDHPERPGFAGDFGVTPAPRGAYSGLSAGGPVNETDARAQLETAYVEFDGGYGELRVGRDRGAAARLFEGAPSVLSHAGIANAYLDPMGVKAIRTNHDLTGPSTKITYASPRILGLRAAASFSPDADVPGLDRDIARLDEGLEVKNAAEVALNLSRRLRSAGMRFESAIAWSSAEVESPSPGVAGRVETFSAGANFEFDSFEFGGSWLTSDNGFEGASTYNAWEIGAETSFGETAVSLNYGEAEDELAGIDSEGFSVAARRRLMDGLDLAVSYQDEILSFGPNQSGGTGVVVEITLSGDFFELNGN